MSETSPFRHAKADDSPGFLLWKLTALWQQRLAEALDAHGITQTQYAILASLRWFEEQGEPPTQARLADHTRIEKMTLSKALRRLEAERLVKRSASKHDHRAVEVAFTAKGRKLIPQAVVDIETADAEFFGRLGMHDLATYQVLTAALIDGNTGGD
ncbi:MAG TPA: MarR family transcriptional regulator [Gammaproteobacteria bacterium]|jgi:DNA-binding MarR family transcriptional regulator